MTDCSLDLNKFQGRGYDDCSTMKAVLVNISKAKHYFLLCSLQIKLDLNKITVIRNTNGIAKAIIKFFHESKIRKNLYLIYHFYAKHACHRNIKVKENFRKILRNNEKFKIIIKQRRMFIFKFNTTSL